MNENCLKRELNKIQTKVQISIHHPQVNGKIPTSTTIINATYITEEQDCRLDMCKWLIVRHQMEKRSFNMNLKMKATMSHMTGKSLN